jgi:magnesium transporter
MGGKTRRVRSRQYSSRRKTPPGASPGTLSPDPGAPAPVIQIIAYGPSEIEERQVHSVEELRSFPRTKPVTWINVDGLGDADTIRVMAEIFQLHPLAQEDILNVYQRAKVEPYGEHLFMVCRMFHRPSDQNESEQLALYVGPGFLLTFQEIPGDCLDPVRIRLRQGGSRLRGAGPDYLAYALLDAVIDAYFPVLEQCGERLETLEEEILTKPTPSTIQGIHEIKRELLFLRRAAWPLREAISVLLRDPVPIIQDETRLYLRDCYDHTVQIIDLIETYRELGADLTDVYLSSISQRTNEIMRLLTVISTIFIPLTFLVGLWGMNFAPDSSPFNMPELRWRYGYPLALTLMALLGGVMLIAFRRRGWLGQPRTKPARNAEMNVKAPPEGTNPRSSQSTERAAGPS